MVPNVLPSHSLYDSVYAIHPAVPAPSADNFAISNHKLFKGVREIFPLPKIVIGGPNTAEISWAAKLVATRCRDFLGHICKFWSDVDVSILRWTSRSTQDMSRKMHQGVAPHRWCTSSHPPPHTRLPGGAIDVRQTYILKVAIALDLDRKVGP